MKTLSNPIKLYAASLAVAVAAAFATNAIGAPLGHGSIGHGAMMHAGHGGPMMGGMLPRLLERVNATPEQRTQIKQIMDANANELRGQRETGRALRVQAMALFAQPTVDANALEALRQKQLALHDATSKRFMTAMLEVSRVLTPEQRKQMAEQMAQRREMMQRHQHERKSLDAPKS